MLKKLKETQKELQDLKAALNEHAIVAVTDSQGNIIQINEKFCQISKYSREELLGQTHRIINSGYHPKEFFEKLWQTISSGEVWKGEICNRAKDGELYWVATTIYPVIGDQKSPLQYVAIRADITQRKRSEKEAKQMAFYDPLTNLPNRRLLKERLEQAALTQSKGGGECAMLMLDLDNFKETNDFFGHNIGDELLRLIADRLTQNVRGTDTVARFGGDEFIILLENLDTDPEVAGQQMMKVADKIRSALATDFFLAGRHVSSSVSIGVTPFNAKTPIYEALKQADIAMYQAKSLGRDQVCLFKPAMLVEVEAQAQRMADLRHAILRDEFKLFYQPIVSSTGTIQGYEALIRWQHPELGMISPADFIPLLEQSGLIMVVGRWVLKTALQKLALWAQDPETQHLTLAVNISAVQFANDRFVSSVETALEAIGAPPSQLFMELTENTFHRNTKQLIERINRLKLLGIRFALDDFGTGYSSLSYLKSLPLDTLKIDRSFVTPVTTDPKSAAITQTILDLAHILNIKTVAEGVETVEQAEFLRASGCDAFQGYLFGKPQANTL